MSMSETTEPTVFAERGAAPPTPSTDAVGATFSAAWGEFSYGPYTAFPSQRQAVQEYWLMAQYEPTVRRVLTVLRTFIMGTIGEYQHEDAATEETIRGLLSRTAGGPAQIVSDLLSALWAGFAVLEPVWETTAHEWTMKRLDLLHPFTFFGDGFGDSAEFGIQLDATEKRVVELVQQPQGLDGRAVTHHADDMIYWPAFQRVREEVYGNSLLTGARRAWYAQTKLENYWNTYAEKCAMPTPWFVVPPGTVEDPDTQQDVGRAAYLMKIYEQLSPGEAIAFAGDPDMAISQGTIVPTGDGEGFRLICDYWKDAMYNSMLLPRMLLDEPRHGSRAQADTMMELALLLVDGFRTELGRVLVDQVVGLLARYNVGALATPGTWEWDPLQADDLERLASVFESVQRGMQAGAMAGVGLPEADERKLRETFGAVLASPGEVEQERGQARDEEQEQDEEQEGDEHEEG